MANFFYTNFKSTNYYYVIYVREVKYYLFSFFFLGIKRELFVYLMNVYICGWDLWTVRCSNSNPGEKKTKIE